MSFQNYENFPNQQGPQDGGPGGSGAPQQQDVTMVGQMPDNAAAQFQAGNGGDLGSAGGPQQGGDAKTTLWYELPTVLIPFFLLVAASFATFPSWLKDVKV